MRRRINCVLNFGNTVAGMTVRLVSPKFLQKDDWIPVSRTQKPFTWPVEGRDYHVKANSADGILLEEISNPSGRSPKGVESELTFPHKAFERKL